MAVLALATGTAGRWALRRSFPLLGGDAQRVLPGLRVDGVPVPDAAGAIHAVADERCRALASRRVRLLARAVGGEADVVLEATLGELGVSADPDEVSRRALRLGRSGDL